MIDKPSIDVAIVNWNTAELAIKAASAYHKSTGVTTRVVVFDNNSEPAQREILARAGDAEFKLFLSSDNLGFGAAANAVLKDGDGEFVLVSNSDVAPEPDTISKLVMAATENPQAGMIGPVFGGERDIYHDHLPSPFVLLIRPLIGSFGRSAIRPPAPGKVLWIEQPSGACFLMRRPVWEDVGGFDPGFFLWYEDVDLAKRLHDTGHQGLIVGDSRVGHLGGKSFARLDERRKQAIRLDSLGRYIGKHHPKAAMLAKPLLWLAHNSRARNQTSDPVGRSAPSAPNWPVK